MRVFEPKRFGTGCSVRLDNNFNKAIVKGYSSLRVSKSSNSAYKIIIADNLCIKIKCFNSCLPLCHDFDNC